MSIQILIILGYVAVTVFVGFLTKKRSKTTSSFQGANLGVLMCVCAAAGEWLGGTSTDGVSEYGFTYGLSGAWYTIANGIGILFLSIFFAKLYRSLETGTVPGIIEKFIGVKARVVSSLMLTLVMLAVGLSQMIAAGKFGESILHIPFTISVICAAAIFILYTLAGGMNAVASTNVLHVFIMYFGVILALILSLIKIGGFGTLVQTLPPSYFSMSTIGWPKVSSWIIASLLGACTAQAGLQPILAARDIHVAKKSAVITAFIVAPFGLITATLGMIGRVTFPSLTDAKLSLPNLMMSLNPVAGGIVLAAVLAAIFSTISPIILAVGTMVSRDIYQRKLKPDTSDAQALRVTRIVTALAAVLCSIGAIALHNRTKLLDIVYFAYSMRGSLFVVLLLAIVWKKVSDTSAVITMIITTLVGFLWETYYVFTGSYPIHPFLTDTYTSVGAALICTILFSLIFPKSGRCKLSGQRKVS